MTTDTLVPEAPLTTADTADATSSTEAASVETSAVAGKTSKSSDGAPSASEKPKKAPAKTKTLELTLTVTGTADGEWRAELKRGTTYVARDLSVAAAAVSRAAKQLHEDISTPIDELIEEARTQQAAKIAALETELEAARKALAKLE